MNKLEPFGIDPRAIRSKWYQNVLRDWSPDPNYIEFIVSEFEQEKYVPPIIVVQEQGDYFVVDGHHRLFAALKIGLSEIRCLLIAGTFAESELLRKAELLLKEFDRKTNYNYRFSGHLRRWAADADSRLLEGLYQEGLAVRFSRSFRMLIGSLKKKWLRKGTWEQ